MSVNRVIGQVHRMKLKLLALIAVVCLFNAGCASSVGTRSSWELWNMTGSQGTFGHVKRTVDLLEGSNDFSDVAKSAELLMQGPESGFRVIGRDLHQTFWGPFSFEELRSTFRLLR